MPIHNKAKGNPRSILQVGDQEMKESSVHKEQQEPGIPKGSVH